MIIRNIQHNKETMYHGHICLNDNQCKGKNVQLIFLTTNLYLEIYSITKHKLPKIIDPKNHPNNIRLNTISVILFVCCILLKITLYNIAENIALDSLLEETTKELLSILRKKPH